MSNADFQARLARLETSSTDQSQSGHIGQKKNRTKRAKLDYKRLFLGAIFLAVGVQLMRFTNENYEMLPDSVGIGTAIALGVGSFLSIGLSIPLILRAFSRKADASGVSSHPTPTVRQASNREKTFMSLLGLAFGAIACFYMFLSAAAEHFDTEKAATVSFGGLIIAVSLLLLSLLFGVVALIFRGRALGRVQVCFVIGGILTFLAVRLGGINFLRWEDYVLYLQ